MSNSSVTQSLLAPSFSADPLAPTGLLGGLSGLATQFTSIQVSPPTMGVPEPTTLSLLLGGLVGLGRWGCRVPCNPRN